MLIDWNVHQFLILLPKSLGAPEPLQIVLKTAESVLLRRIIIIIIIISRTEWRNLTGILVID